METSADQRESLEGPPVRTVRAVVGIGASAGGLAAYETFFSHYPAEQRPGLAFVLIQHLSPDHKSILKELIARQTSLSVLEIEDGMEVNPDTIYILPPSYDLTLGQGRFVLEECSQPRGHRLPIDHFFDSLANDREEASVGIILSGGGSDGSQGVRAIKAVGGMIMVQEPSTATQVGMPESALATGTADFILSPEDMPARLLAFLERPPKSEEVDWDRNPEILGKILAVLHSQVGHDFGSYKSNTLIRRIERRIAVHQLDGPESYLECLQDNLAEAHALFRDLLIGVTSFFRDPDAFAALGKEILPKALQDRDPDSPFRVWVAGCSTGEEAYSIAILLQEQKDLLEQDFCIQLFATDLDSKAIDTARAGVFGPSIASTVSPQRLSRFFVYQRETDCYIVKKVIRDMVIFSEHDLTRDPPFSRIDLLSCRNVLIYMNLDLHQRLLSLFHYAIRPNGFLFLGSAETVGGASSLFSPAVREKKLYQRKRGSGTGRTGVKTFQASTISSKVPAVSSERRSDWNARALTERFMLLAFDATGILIDAEGCIIFIQGRAGHYLEPASGFAEMNILRMARPGLRRPLQLALQQSMESGESVTKEGLQISQDEEILWLTMTVRVIPPKVHQPPLRLVILQKSTAPPPGRVSSQALSLSGSQEATEEIVEALRLELRRKEDSLQITTEALETSNEELRSSNEELQSVNEELQSTNEELETSKEELQSVNEELSTVNSELQAKVTALTRANDDMNNLLAGTGVGTVFVDHKLAVMRFTPAVTQVLNLIPVDLGRPVSHIASNLVGYNTLIEDIQSVLDTLIPLEVEVQARNQSWFLLRIRPYRTLDNVIEGAVITFIDISEMRIARDTLEASEHWLRLLAESLPQLVWTSTRDGASNYFSPQWCSYTGVSQEALLGFGWIQKVHPEERAGSLEAWTKGIRSGCSFELDFRLYGTSTESYQRFRTRVIPLPSPLGSSTGWFATSTVCSKEPVDE